MKELNNYLLEKLKINKNTKTNPKFILIDAHGTDVEDELESKYKVTRLNYGGIRKSEQDWSPVFVVPIEDLDKYMDKNGIDIYELPDDLEGFNQIDQALIHSEYCSIDLKQIKGDFMTEKLNINKDTKLNKYSDFYADLYSYLDDKEYFGYKKEEFSFSESEWKEHKTIILHLPKGFKFIYIDEIEDDISKLYKSKSKFNDLSFMTKDFNEPHITFIME